MQLATDQSKNADEVIGTALNKLSQISEATTTTEWTSLQQSLDQRFEHYSEARENPSKFTGINTEPNVLVLWLLYVQLSGNRRWRCFLEVLIRRRIGQSSVQTSLKGSNQGMFSL